MGLAINEENLDSWTSRFVLNHIGEITDEMIFNQQFLMTLSSQFVTAQQLCVNGHDHGT